MSTSVALAEWLRRVPAKYMGFPRESSNLSGDEELFLFTYFVSRNLMYLPRNLSVTVLGRWYVGQGATKSASRKIVYVASQQDTWT
ncbi:putative transmembrane protein [Cucumis melo var. makuwa]|uniref:Transmembrane protein n=1 Tax=Cucumis melo var. makuwa TaxID=1194695 RepID=A0A5A7T438_CUCMM|nr:putative transmembrane protein [Cucumis melo var. makuwa]TYK12731.1 putative transmembrane protein [Cucumis melo var. makuwa]